MSWDVGVRVRSGPDSYVYTEDYNYTYNCGPMFHSACGMSLSVALDGKPCDDAGILLAYVIEQLETNPTHYDKLNPRNGWGSRQGFVEFLKKIRDLCYEHPFGEVRVT